MTTLQEQLKSACEDGGQIQFRNDYSGRGMYGERCVGVVGNMRHIMEMIADIIKQESDELVESALNALDGEEDSIEKAQGNFNSNVDTLLKFTTDNMGLDTIVYWRRLSPIEE